jgi:hypothetical protein
VAEEVQERLHVLTFQQRSIPRQRMNRVQYIIQLLDVRIQDSERRRQFIIHFLPSLSREVRFGT